MKREEILQLLHQHSNELKGYHVRSLGVFGSVARDEAAPDSDVDLVVSFDGPATFDCYIELCFFLENLLKRPVDLLTERSLTPALRKEMERDAYYVEGLPALSE
jgi:predicted nucleotidyltransferase